MDTAPDLAAVARLLADGTRARICWALLDRRAWTPTEVARHTGVASTQRRTAKPTCSNGLASLFAWLR